MTESLPIGTSMPSIRLGDAGQEQARSEWLARARAERWAERLFERDTSLWTTDAGVAATISERLGWLDAPAHFRLQIPALEGFGDGARDAGFRAAVVAGMGGSSLAPDVLRKTFGTTEGWLEVRVLDSTDPAAVAAVVDDLDPLATLVIVATKSGTTTEPLAFLADAWARIDAALRAHDARRSESPGELMAVITDPGKSLDAIPHHDELRAVFLNPPDIGGRYSALTYVGLVPGSLLGLDIDALIASSEAMRAACREPDPERNPGLSLGLAMGALARVGRDKLTFIADPAIESFGAWAEQLIAESTGKHGVGIVPIDLEPLGAAAAYGPDRAFVRLSVAGGEPPAGADALLAELEAAGHPVIRIELADPIDVAAEFVRWEVATAIAGAVLGIDPFDQPNVEEAKELTRRVLARHGQEEAAAADRETATATPGPLVEADGIALHGDAALRLTHAGDRSVAAELARHLARAKPQAYLALQAFIAPTPARDAAIARIRAMLRDHTTRPTTAGYGPRFLHSTGQLHKGGAPIGWFLQLTSDHPADRPIPGWPYTFGGLIDGQAAGDFAAIESHDLPIMRVHLGPDPDAGLAALERALAGVLGDTTREA